MYVTIKNYLTVGIKENEGEATINLFPNPTNNELTINLNNAGKQVEISITDVIGKIIYTTVLADTKLLLNTKDFAEGIYMVKVRTEEFSATKKLVITR